MKVSIIMTVKNERQHLAEWFVSMHAQTIQPDQIVIIDGGSTDGTWKLLQSEAAVWPICMVEQASGNISMGRNIAIRMAAGDVIVSTDAGCTYDPTWLARLTAPFADEEAVFATTAHAPWLTLDDSPMSFLIAAATTPAPKEFLRDWLPSSRSVAFRKTLWQDVGGYPEWLPICEDIVFDKNILARGIAPVYIREPLVRWRTRETIREYLRQVFLYTRGDGHAKLFLGRQLIRFSVYGGTILILLLSLDTAIYWPLYGLVFASPVYMKKFWQRYLVYTRGQSYVRRAIGLMVLPFVIVCGDVSKMIGWPIGVIERWRGIIRAL